MSAQKKKKLRRKRNVLYGILLIIAGFVLVFLLRNTDSVREEEAKQVNQGEHLSTEKVNLAQMVAQKQYPYAPELSPDGQWFNSPPLTIASLRGKVVLLDFWAYTCINCIRTLPYLHDLHVKYADQGLVIIGVHSPRYEIEKNAAGVQKAITDFGIIYPVVQDNKVETWFAYENRYLPSKYFIDRKGKIRMIQIGEGGYDVAEKEIQDLLEEK